MAYKTTAETAPYKPGKTHGYQGDAKASYTPSAAINEHAYGKDGGKPAILGTVPQVQVGGSSESAPLPKAFTGDFSVGDDKNVSTPVSG